MFGSAVLLDCDLEFVSPLNGSCIPVPAGAITGNKVKSWGS